MDDVYKHHRIDIPPRNCGINWRVGKDIGPMGHTKPAPANNASVDGPVHNLALLKMLGTKNLKNIPLMMV